MSGRLSDRLRKRRNSVRKRRESLSEKKEGSISFIGGEVNEFKIEYLSFDDKTTGILEQNLLCPSDLEGEFVEFSVKLERYFKETIEKNPMLTADSKIVNISIFKVDEFGQEHGDKTIAQRKWRITRSLLGRSVMEKKEESSLLSCPEEQGGEWYLKFETDKNLVVRVRIFFNEIDHILKSEETKPGCVKIIVEEDSMEDDPDPSVKMGYLWDIRRFPVKENIKYSDLVHMILLFHQNNQKFRILSNCSQSFAKYMFVSCGIAYILSSNQLFLEKFRFYPMNHIQFLEVMGCSLSRRVESEDDVLKKPTGIKRRLSSVKRKLSRIGTAPGRRGSKGTRIRDRFYPFLKNQKKEFLTGMNLLNRVFPHLTKLRFFKCVLGDVHLNPGNIMKQEALTYLIINHSSITSSGVKMIIERYPNLENLVIRNSKLEKNLTVLFNSWGGEKLQFIDFSYNSFKNKGLVVILRRFCKGVKKIMMKGCEISKVSESDISELPERVEVEQLDLGENRKLTSRCVERIKRVCPLLQSLEYDEGEEEAKKEVYVTYEISELEIGALKNLALVAGAKPEECDLLDIRFKMLGTEALPVVRSKVTYRQFQSILEDGKGRKEKLDTFMEIICSSIEGNDSREVLLNFELEYISVKKKLQGDEGGKKKEKNKFRYELEIKAKCEEGEGWAGKDFKVRAWLDIGKDKKVKERYPRCSVVITDWSDEDEDDEEEEDDPFESFGAGGESASTDEKGESKEKKKKIMMMESSEEELEGEGEDDDAKEGISLDDIDPEDGHVYTTFHPNLLKVKKYTCPDNMRLRDFFLGIFDFSLGCCKFWKKSSFSSKNFCKFFVSNLSKISGINDRMININEFVNFPRNKNENAVISDSTFFLLKTNVWKEFEIQVKKIVKNQHGLLLLPEKYMKKLWKNMSSSEKNRQEKKMVMKVSEDLGKQSEKEFRWGQGREAWREMYHFVVYDEQETQNQEQQDLKTKKKKKKPNRRRRSSSTSSRHELESEDGSYVKGLDLLVQLFGGNLKRLSILDTIVEDDNMSIDVTKKSEHYEGRGGEIISTLIVNQSRMTRDGVSKLMKELPNLKVLVLQMDYRLKILKNQYSCYNLENSFKKSKTLHILDLSNHQELGKQGMKKILKNCPNLEYLALVRCGIEALNEKEIQNYFPTHSKLTFLNISENQIVLNEEAFFQLFFPNLETIIMLLHYPLEKYSIHPSKYARITKEEEEEGEEGEQQQPNIYLDEMSEVEVGDPKTTRIANLAKQYVDQKKKRKWNYLTCLFGEFRVNTVRRKEKSFHFVNIDEGSRKGFFINLSKGDKKVEEEGEGEDEGEEQEEEKEEEEAENEEGDDAKKAEEYAKLSNELNKAHMKNLKTQNLLFNVLPEHHKMMLHNPKVISFSLIGKSKMYTNHKDENSSLLSHGYGSFRDCLLMVECQDISRKKKSKKKSVFFTIRINPFGTIEIQFSRNEDRFIESTTTTTTTTSEKKKYLEYSKFNFLDRSFVRIRKFLPTAQVSYMKLSYVFDSLFSYVKVMESEGGKDFGILSNDAMMRYMMMRTCDCFILHDICFVLNKCRYFPRGMNSSLLLKNCSFTKTVDPDDDDYFDSDKFSLSGKRVDVQDTEKRSNQGKFAAVYQNNPHLEFVRTTTSIREYPFMKKIRVKPGVGLIHSTDLIFTVFPYLACLDFVGCKLSDYHFGTFNRNNQYPLPTVKWKYENLINLKINRSRITFHGLALILERFPNLQYLSVLNSRLGHPSASSSRAIPPVKLVESVNFDPTQGLKFIRAHKNIRRVDFSGNRKFGSDGVQMIIKRFRNLEVAVLQNCGIKDMDFKKKYSQSIQFLEERRIRKFCVCRNPITQENFVEILSRLQLLNHSFQSAGHRKKEETLQRLQLKINMKLGVDVKKKKKEEEEEEDTESILQRFIEESVMCDCGEKYDIKKKKLEVRTFPWIPRTKYSIGATTVSKRMKILPKKLPKLPPTPTTPTSPKTPSPSKETSPKKIWDDEEEVGSDQPEEEDIEEILKPLEVRNADEEVVDEIRKLSSQRDLKCDVCEELIDEVDDSVIKCGEVGCRNVVHTPKSSSWCSNGHYDYYRCKFCSFF